MPDAPQFQIVNGWLAQYVGHHTCGTSQDGHYGAHEPGCGWEPVCTLSDLPKLLAPAPAQSPLASLEDYVGALLGALADARAYRLGEASGLDDPDLDMDDRQHLLRYEDAERTLVAVVDECTRCGHRHLVECDGLRPDPDPEGDHAMLHCGCPEPETSVETCPACRRIPQEGEQHGMHVHRSPDPDVEPDVACLTPDGQELAPMPTDPWYTGTNPEPAF